MRIISPAENAASSRSAARRASWSAVPRPVPATATLAARSGVFEPSTTRSASLVGRLSVVGAPFSGTPCRRPCSSVERVGAGGSAAAVIASCRNPLVAGFSIFAAGATRPEATDVTAALPDPADAACV